MHHNVGFPVLPTLLRKGLAVLLVTSLLAACGGGKDNDNVGSSNGQLLAATSLNTIARSDIAQAAQVALRWCRIFKRSTTCAPTGSNT